MGLVRAENNSQNVFTDGHKDGMMIKGKIRVIFDDGSALTIDNPMFAQIKEGRLEVYEADCAYFVEMSKARFVETVYEN